MHKKWLLSLILLLICSIMISCEKEEIIQEEKESETAMTNLTITTPYTVVRPDVSEQLIIDLSVNLKNALSENGLDISLTTDWSKDGSYDPSAPEILIGDTNRSESAMPKAKAEEAGMENWYYIGIEGSKIVFNGSNDTCIMAAVRRYIAEFAEQNSASSMTVPTSLLVSYDPEKITLIENAKGSPTVFVAVANLGDDPYYADSTGAADMTDVIQIAIDHAANAGGGTVYLPSGVYRITEGLNIPSYVTLRGDYADPDSEDITAGTVLLLAQKGNFKVDSAVSINHSAAVQGITFYYEGQSVESPIEYAPTVNLLSQGVTTVKDCNFINSWTAIYNGVSPNGMVTIDTVKGTALYNALHSDQRADISITTNIHFSPKYWAQGSEVLGEAPTEAAIRDLMKSNKSEAKRS